MKRIFSFTASKKLHGNPNSRLFWSAVARHRFVTQTFASHTRASLIRLTDIRIDDLPQTRWEGARMTKRRRAGALQVRYGGEFRGRLLNLQSDDW